MCIYVLQLQPPDGQPTVQPSLPRSRLFRFYGHVFGSEDKIHQQPESPWVGLSEAFIRVINPFVKVVNRTQNPLMVKLVWLAKSAVHILNFAKRLNYFLVASLLQEETW